MTSPGARYSAGTAFLEVIPSFDGVQKAIAREARKMQEALGKEAGDQFGKSFEASAGKAVDQVLGTTASKDAEKKGAEAGKRYAGAFSEQMKTAVRAANREINATIKLAADDKPFQSQLRAIKGELADISKAKIGINMDAGKALAIVEGVGGRLRDLQRAASRVDLGMNTGTAAASVEKIKKQVESIKAQIEVKVDERQIGNFERTVKQRLNSALNNLPPVKLTAESSDADRKIAELRKKMDKLGSKRIGIDIDAAKVNRKAEEIRRELATLAMDTTVNIQARTDAAAAAKDLLALRGLAELVDKTRVEIKVDVDTSKPISRMSRLRTELLGLDANGQGAANSFRSFNAVVLAGAALLPGLVPVLGAVAGGLALIGPLAAGAGAGLAVMAIGFGGIGDATKAYAKVAENSATDALAASKKLQTANRGVEDAQRAVASAEESAATSGAAAQRRVSDARENASEVARNASRAVARAVEDQKDAEQDLARAQAGVVAAQEDVTRAREAAREAQEDLNLSVRGGVLDEREAVLRLREETEALAAAREEGLTGDDLDKAILDYDKAVLRLDEARERNGDLSEEAAKWARTGVEGSDQVVDAQGRVVEAQRGVREAQERVADSVAAVSEAVAEGQRAQSRAAREITDAVADQARVQADGARAVEDAQRNLTQAQQDYSRALFETGTIGSESMQALEVAMGKLSPAGRRFVAFFDSMLPQFRELRSLAQEGMFPGLQSGLDQVMRENGPLLREFMFSMGSTLGDLFDRFGALMTSPQWQGIWKTFNEYAPIFLRQFGEMAMAMLTFFGELFQGLAPYAERFGRALVDISRDAAAWANSWTESSGFKQFMEWMFTTGPIIWEAIRDIARAIMDILIALEPLGMLVLGVVAAFAEFLSTMDPQTLAIIATGVMGLVVAFQLAVGAVALFTSGMNILGTPIAKFVFIIGALTTGLIILYTQSESFRAAMDGVASVVGAVMGLFFDFMGMILGPLVSLLEDNAEVVVSLAIAFGLLKFAPIVLANIKMALTLVGLSAAGAAAGLGTAAGAMAALRAAGTGLVGFLGGPWGIALLAAAAVVGFFIKNLNDATEAEQKWATAMGEGGKAASDAMAEYKKQRDDAVGFEWMKDLDEWTGLAPSIDEATAAAGRAYYALDDLGRAEKSAEYWANELAHRTKTLGRNHEDTIIAQERHAYWTGEVEREQAELDQTLTGVNQRLLDQQERTLALAEAEIAFAQSTDQLRQAHERSKQALIESGEGSQEYIDAQFRLEQQMMSTAEAASRVAEEKYKDASAAVAAQAPNAALLANLIAQEEEYGALPPRLREIKEELLLQIPAAELARAQMDRLSAAIISIPDRKTMIVDDAGTTDAEIQRLKDLGLEVTQLPNGDYEVIARTEEAEKALAELTRDRTINIVTDIATKAAQKIGGVFGGFAGKWATGGPIVGPGGPTSDVIPAWLSNGEFVMKASSVQRYGVDFFNQLNAGRFATGGLVGGRMPFRDGGLASTASWGGTITLSGGDPSPLAQFWFEAINQINEAAAIGTDVISRRFAMLRDSVVNTSRELRRGVEGEWAPFIAGLIGGADRGRMDVSGIFDNLRQNVINRSFETAVGVTRNWEDLRIRSTGTAGQLERDNSSIFGLMRDSVSGIVGDAVNRMSNSWGTLPGRLAGPANRVIDAVLNKGLFAAFNAAVDSMGLDGKIKVPLAAPVPQLAAGGKVPGYSPTATADNIPAWLTAGEFVQPVDVVNHYGVDFMERLRRKELPRYATGGYVAMSRAITNQFPWARITSTLRPGDPGWHGKGMAVDIGGSRPYPDRTAIQQMLQINRWIASSFSNITELIHTQPGAINLYRGKPHTYNAGTQAEHRNHVHWAQAAGLIPGGSTPLGGMIFDILSNPVEGIRNAVEAALKDFDGGVPAKVIMAQGARKLAELAANKAADWMGNITFGLGDAAPAANLTGSRAANEAIVQRMAAARGWTGGEWSALHRLIMKESGFNNTAQNPTSTAYGMFQFLNSTWAGYGQKTADPAGQTAAGLAYIADRYGSPSKALAFHNRNNWYSEGGEVGPAVGKGDAGAPTLYDTGGWLPPGITTVLNATNRPEPVLTGQAWDELVSARSTDYDGERRGIRELHLHEQKYDVAEAVDAVNHYVRVLEKGGRY